MNRFIITLCLTCFCQFSVLANASFWQPLSHAGGADTVVTEYVLDEEALLAHALSQSVITVPLYNGDMVSFAITPANVMPHELQERFPEIRAFKGKSIGSDEYTARFDFSHKGFKALVRNRKTSQSGKIVKQPNQVYRAQKAHKHSHSDRPNNLMAPIEVPSTPELQPITTNPSEQDIPLAATGLQTEYNFRIAIATTGEFTQFYGGTVADGLAEVNSIVNRINGIYEDDLGVQFTLVADNDQLIYTDASNDPYSNTNLVGDLEANHSNINTVIGAANYDIGHVLGTAGGGVAGLNTLCSSNAKGWGYSGINNGNDIGEDDFWIDIVGHEIGHQLGAEHIYNATAGVCTTRSENSAYEIGSGSTIMSYAGLCSELNTVNTSDPYYNSHSIAQMRGKLATIPNSCGSSTITTNNNPTANAGSDYTIPANTFFALKGSATDSNAGDTLSFVWEQRDLGATERTVADVNTDEGSGPLFRSVAPSSAKTRLFPALESIRSGTTAFGETIPSSSRNVNFYFTVRDNEGGVAVDNMTVTTVANSIGFTMLEPIAGQAITENPVLIRWNVSNSDQSPINCSAVDVLLSENDGDDFYEIARDVTNDGSYIIDLPLTSGVQNNQMLRVKCADNIFFAQHSGVISTDLTSTGSNFTITAQTPLNIAQGEDTITLVTANFTVSGLTPTALIIMNGPDYRVSGDNVIVDAGVSGDISVRLRATDGTDVTALYSATISVGGTPEDPNGNDNDGADDGNDGADDSNDGADDGNDDGSADGTDEDTNNDPDTPADAVDFTIVENSQNNKLDILSLYTGTESVTILSATHTVAGGTPGTDRVSVTPDGLALLYSPLPNSTDIETISATLSNNIVLAATVRPLPEIGMILGFPGGAQIDEDGTYAFELDDFVATIMPTALRVEEGINYTFEDNILTPDPNFNGTLLVNVRLTDGYSFTELFTIDNFIVAPVNDSPVLNADSPVIYQNSENNVIDVLDNDFDIDQGDVLTLTQAITDANGTVSIVNNQLVYTPNGSYIGEARISYSVSDGSTTVINELVFTVLPVIYQQVLNTDINTPFTFTATDFALNFPIASITVLAGENYTVTNNTVTPAQDYAGILTVRVRIDGTGAESTVYNAFLVVGTLNNNTPPIAVNDNFTVNQNSNNNVLNVLANDSDADVDDIITISQASVDGNGRVSFTSDRIIYTPANSMTGTETITYTITDGIHTVQASAVMTVDQRIFQDTIVTDGSVPLSFSPADFAVNFVVTSVQVLPGDNYTVAFNGAVFESGFQGEVQVRVRLNGANTVTDYLARITVDTGNDAPTAVADTLTLTEDSDAVTVDVLANDTDLDGDTLTLTVAFANNGGTVSIVNNEISYTPAPDFSGIETVSYTVADPEGLTGIGTLTVTVTNIPDAPVAVDDTFRANINQTNFMIDVLDNDTDPDTENLILTEVNTAGSGSVSIVNNQVQYTPAREFTGDEVITYTVSDGVLTDEGTLTITVEDSTILNDGSHVNSQAGSMGLWWMCGIVTMLAIRRSKLKMIWPKLR